MPQQQPVYAFLEASRAFQMGLVGSTHYYKLHEDVRLFENGFNWLFDGGGLTFFSLLMLWSKILAGQKNDVIDGGMTCTIVTLSHGVLVLYVTISHNTGWKGGQSGAYWYGHRFKGVMMNS